MGLLLASLRISCANVPTVQCGVDGRSGDPADVGLRIARHGSASNLFARWSGSLGAVPKVPKLRALRDILERLELFVQGNELVEFIAVHIATAPSV